MSAAIGQKAIIFAPKTAPPAKIAQLLIYGAKVILVDGNYDQAHWMQELSDGHWLVGGRFEKANKNLVRLNPNGSLDPGFNCELEGGSLVSAAVRSDGSIVAAGALHSWSGGSHYFALALLDANGATVTEVSELEHIVTSVAVDAEDNVLIAGFFTAAFGQPRRGVARLNCDLTLDVSFDPALNHNSQVSALVVQPDGQVLVSGWLTDTNGWWAPDNAPRGRRPFAERRPSSGIRWSNRRSYFSIFKSHGPSA